MNPYEKDKDKLEAIRKKAQEQNTVLQDKIYLTGIYKGPGIRLHCGLIATDKEFFLVLGPYATNGDLIGCIVLTVLILPLGLIALIGHFVKGRKYRKNYDAFEAKNIQALRRMQTAFVMPITSLKKVDFNIDALVFTINGKFPFNYKFGGKKATILVEKKDTQAYITLSKYIQSKILQKSN